MSMPPPPGQWGPSGPPPPPGPPQQGPPAGYYPPPGPWGGPPQPPPTRNNTIKWLLAGVGVLLIIAITVGVTAIVLRDGSGGDGPITTPTSEPIASADDDGPIEIITLEPTCQAWMPVRDAMARVQENGWGERDSSRPAVDWTDTERTQYEAVAKSLRDTADQAVIFAGQTPNRVVRELYEQFIAYSRAYADSIATYVPEDNYLVQTNIAASTAITSICNSITYGSAAARSNAVSPIDTAAVSDDSNPDQPERVVTEADPACHRLDDLYEGLVEDTDGWAEQDPNIAAVYWSPEERAVGDKTAAALELFSRQIQSLAPQGNNSTFEDLALMSAVYLLAFAESLETYEPADNYLFIAGTRANNVLVTACRATSG